MSNRADIEKKAIEIYSKYYKKGKPAEKIYKIMEGEGIVFKSVDIKDERFLGALTRTPKGKPCIIINNNIVIEGRKNFTIAHEFGHFTLGHQLQNISFFCGEKEIFGDNDNISNQERDANCFASYFLMPKTKITNEFSRWYKNRFYGSFSSQKRIFLHINPADKSYSDWKKIDYKLTKYFGVSTFALKIRLVELKLINNF